MTLASAPDESGFAQRIIANILARGNTRAQCVIGQENGVHFEVDALCYDV